LELISQFCLNVTQKASSLHDSVRKPINK